MNLVCLNIILFIPVSYKYSCAYDVHIPLPLSYCNINFYICVSLHTCEYLSYWVGQPAINMRVLGVYLRHKSI